MSGSSSRWTELSSQNERVIRLDEPEVSPAHSASRAARPNWAELASQTERLVTDGDPQFRLASSSRGTTAMRLVASTAA
ncbi:MAG: hypothetical protein WAK71_03940 [Streptosporangiaceae bacterium]